MTQLAAAGLDPKIFSIGTTTPNDLFTNTLGNRLKPSNETIVLTGIVSASCALLPLSPKIKTVLLIAGLGLTTYALYALCSDTAHKISVSPCIAESTQLIQSTPLPGITHTTSARAPIKIRKIMKYLPKQAPRKPLTLMKTIHELPEDIYFEDRPVTGSPNTPDIFETSPEESFED